ncbi:MAG: hypothetical protein ABIT08_17820 [Bacteroidia bacterium]
MEKLIEFGILEDFLKEHCNDQHYSLCDYKDKAELVWGFMWNYDSPANQNGGWKAHEKEYNQIIHDVLSEKKYLKIYIRKSIESAFFQFFTFETGDATKADAEGPPANAIDQCIHADLHSYWANKQVQGKLEFKTLNQLQLFIVFFSSLLILIVYYNKTLNDPELSKIKFLFNSLLLFLFFNAIVCSNLSTIGGRYQSRVIWLIPLFTLIYISNIDFKSGIRKLLKTEN